MIRTRAIIGNLSYDNLVKLAIIPDLCFLINQNPRAIAPKRYPPFVYKTKDFSFFGMFWDYVIRAGLRVNLTKETRPVIGGTILSPQKVDLGVDPNVDMIQQLSEFEMITMMEHLSVYETSNNIHDIVMTSLSLTSNLYGKSPYTHEDIQNYIPTIVNILKEITAKWNWYRTYLSGTVKFNTEYSYKALAGHPDIVVGDKCVLDIKNSCSFSKMAKESCLQVLAYYALMKQTIPNIEYIGFVLPMQRDLVLYNVSNWDPSRYLELLSTEAVKLNNKQLIIGDNGKLTAQHRVIITMNDNFDLGALAEHLESINMNNLAPEDRDALMQVVLGALQEEASDNNGFKIGCHIAKGKNISITLRNFANSYPGLPCQMFLANPRTGKKNGKTEVQIQEAAQVIRDTGLQYYTHAPYVINLCANPCDKGDYWAQRYLNEDLAFTVRMGGKGVVVHTGARKLLSEEEALHNMEYMVRTALPHATEECPLLLETPCNEGTEVCGQIQDLGHFFYRFTEDERKKLGVCIDTAHVWGAGYDPLLYFQHWEKYCNTPIKLVHFNDSEVTCGSCVDKHAPPGQGHIGMEKMQAVAEWCNERKIPMIRE